VPPEPEHDRRAHAAGGGFHVEAFQEVERGQPQQQGKREP